MGPKLRTVLFLQSGRPKAKRRTENRLHQRGGEIPSSKNVNGLTLSSL